MAKNITRRVYHTNPATGERTLLREEKGKKKRHVMSIAEFMGILIAIVALFYGIKTDQAVHHRFSELFSVLDTVTTEQIDHMNIDKSEKDKIKLAAKLKKQGKSDDARNVLNDIHKSSLKQIAASFNDSSKAIKPIPATKGVFANDPGIIDNKKAEVLDQDKTLPTTPAAVSALNEQGTDLYNKGSFGKSIETSEKVLALDPDNLVAWNNKGLCLYSMGKYNAAIDCYDKASGIDPKNDQVWFNKGIVYYAMQNYPDAIASYDKALAVNQQDPTIWSNKGNALSNAGKYEDALACYLKAITLEPSNPVIWYNRAYILYKTGGYNEAIASLNKSLELNPAFEEAKKLKEQITQVLKTRK